MKITKTWLNAHDWFLRTSDSGVSHGDFKRKRVGAWNDAGDRWTGEPSCDTCGGFFGIDQEANRFGLLPRETLELCEWRGERVVIDGDKICVSSYRVVAVNDAVPDGALHRCGLRVMRSGIIDTVRSGETVIVRGNGRVRIEAVTGGDVWPCDNSTVRIETVSGGYVRPGDDSTVIVETVSGGWVRPGDNSTMTIEAVSGGEVWPDDNSTVTINHDRRPKT